MSYESESCESEEHYEKCPNAWFEEPRTPITHESLTAAGVIFVDRQGHGYSEYVMPAPGQKGYFSPFIYQADSVSRHVIYVINDKSANISSGLKEGAYVLQTFNMLHFPGVTTIEQLMDLYYFSCGEPYIPKGKE